jgi:hypothetical protein
MTSTSPTLISQSRVFISRLSDNVDCFVSRVSSPTPRGFK